MEEGYKENQGHRARDRRSNGDRARDRGRKWDEWDRGLIKEGK
jgi:hypothetical protein